MRTSIKSTADLGQLFMRLLEQVEENERDRDLRMVFTEVAIVLAYDAYPTDGDGTEEPFDGVMIRRVGSDHAVAGLLQAGVNSIQRKS